jgi:uncharacterized protein (DUF2147 family)
MAFRNGFSSLALAIALAALLLAAIFLAQSSRADQPGPMGLWMTEDNSAVVRIEPCGGVLCGNIAWADKPADAKGRPLCGRGILGDVTKTGPASWGKGWIYSPKTDDKYPVAFTLTADGALALHISAGLFGRDLRCTRPAQPPALCEP